MRRPAGLTAVALTVALSAGLTTVATGCTQEPTPGGTTTTTLVPLPFDGSPSRAELEQLTGLRLGDAVTGYRSARIDSGELHVAVEVPGSQVDALVAASDLPPLTDGRSFIHGSPVWSVVPDGVIRSTRAERDGLELALEVVTTPANPETASIRLVVTAG